MKNFTLKFTITIFLFATLNSFSADNKSIRNFLKTNKTESKDLSTVKKIISYDIQNSPLVSVDAESILNKSALAEDSIPSLLIELDFQDDFWTAIYSERNETNTGWNLFMLLQNFFQNDFEHPDSIIYSDVDTINGGWDAVRKEVIYYNSAGLDTTVISYLYNNESGNWELETKNTYKYDGNGNRIEDTLIVWDPDASEWIKWTKNTFQYSGNLLISDEYFIWDDYNLVWFSGSKSTFSYDNLNRVETQTSYMSDYMGGFIISTLEKYIYMGNTENIDTVMAFTYDAETETYFPDWFDKINYSPIHGMIVSEDSYSLVYDENKSVTENSDFVKEYTWVYYYNDDATSVIPEQTISNTIYPNPANDKVILQIQNPENCRLEVFDLRGQLMFSKQIQSQITPVNINDMESGIYLFRISNNGKSTSKKIVKQ